MPKATGPFFMESFLSWHAKLSGLRFTCAAKRSGWLGDFPDFE
jgi:hypothetical protein